MECITCKTQMKNYDDANTEFIRIDWLTCPKCNSWAEVEYGGHGRYIKKVVWKRDEQ